MKAAYFDASAIVKLLVEEPESLALIEWLEQPIEAMTSTISLTEVTRAIRRHGLVKGDDPEAILDAFVRLDVTGTICRDAAWLEPLGLRSLDAVHLATALSINEPGLDFITYDDRLGRAAEARGFHIVQPGHAQGRNGAKRKRSDRQPRPKA